MAQFWRASSVTVTNGSPFISVQTGDDVALIRPNAILQVATNQYVEVKTVNTSASPQTIEIMESWNGGSSAGLSAIAANVGAPRIDALIATANNLIDVYETIRDDTSTVLNSFERIYTSTDESITIPLTDGDVQVRPWGNVLENAETDINEQVGRVDTVIAQQQAKDKAIRQSTIYSDFAGNFHRLYDSTTKRIGETELEENWTVERTSAAWGFDPSGRLVEYAPNEPRLVIDPATGEAKGLLVDEQRTNLILDSNSVGSSLWNYNNDGTGVTPILNGQNYSAPDGSLTASRLIFDITGYTSSSDLSELQQSRAVNPGDTITQSIWIKSATEQSYTIALYNPSASSPNHIYVVAEPGVWKRVELTKTVVGSSSQLRVGLRNFGVGISNVADILLWGGQMEPGVGSTSLIPTQGTAVTRTADVVSRTLGAEYSDNQGTFTITADAKIGDVLLRCGSLEITADVDGEKTYTASYTSDLNATALEVCPDVPQATVSQLTYKPTVEL